MKKKLAAILMIFTCISNTFSANVFASNVKVKEGKVLEKKIMIHGTKKGESDLELSVYNDNGIKVYKVKGAKNRAEKEKAFIILNNYMENGSVEQTTVYVTSLYTDFYGDEWGYSTQTNNAMGYTWAKYNAGNISASLTNYDKTWGGQSGGWFGSGAPTFIRLRQSVTLNVANASTSLTISWPPSMTVTQTRTSSTATKVFDPDYDSDCIGAEHGLTEFNKEDIQYGIVTSCIYSDSADIRVGSFTYVPSQSVRFVNSI